MSTISLTIPHALSAEEAVARLLPIQAKLSSRFSAQCQWNAHQLQIQHPSLKGTIDVLPGQLKIHATLSFPLSLMQSKIEQELEKMVSDIFAKA